MRTSELLCAGALAAALVAACDADGVNGRTQADGGVSAPDASAEPDASLEADAGRDASVEEDASVEPDASVEEDASVEPDAGSAICLPGSFLCGASGACCATGEDCLQDTCLPACESSVRCGTSHGCCDVGDVCIASQCTTPGSACIDHTQCSEMEFCEPVLGKCLPQLEEPACIFKPPTLPVSLKLEWSWTGSSIYSAFNQVMDTPMAADLDADGVPEAVIVSFSVDAGVRAYLRALDGRTGAEKWAAGVDVYASGNEVRAASTPALGDLDADGKIDIVAFRQSGGLIAFNGDGSLKWKSTQADGTTAYTGSFGESTLGIADLDADGSPEIFAGGVVFESNGKLRFDKGAYVGANQSTYGAVSIAADVDGDGKQELLSGRRAYTHDGTLLWDNGLVDGYPAIADLDLDGMPELVVIAAGKARIHNAATGELLAQATLPGVGAGGPPTIAQFDGEGGPEIASANGTAYSVLRYSTTPTPSLSVLWSKPSQDSSSNRTGSTVFDFNGDGQAEVLYNDECYLRAYDGPTGEVLFQQENSSNTSHEYPVVVDLFGDNRSKLLVVANDLVSANCTAPGYVRRHGLFVYSELNSPWVRTRRIWNQHSYHVTNVNADGSIPAQEPLSWGPQGLNNYRQSTQGKGVFNAPDLAVSLEASLASCPAELRLKARVSNLGSLGVAAGVPVALYRGVPPDGVLVAETTTPNALLPGASVDVTWTLDLSAEGERGGAYYVSVDGKPEGQVDECDETNNSASSSDLSCAP